MTNQPYDVMTREELEERTKPKQGGK